MNPFGSQTMVSTMLLAMVDVWKWARWQLGRQPVLATVSLSPS